jgi:hypothetical protein
VRLVWDILELLNLVAIVAELTGRDASAPRAAAAKPPEAAGSSAGADPPAEGRRERAAAGWGIIVGGLVGPGLVVFTLMGGDGLVVPITVGSSVVAGLLFAVDIRGANGAMGVLLIPLGWAVVLSLLLAGFASDGMTLADILETASVFGLYVLVMAISIESGYVAGRLVARRSRAGR